MRLFTLILAITSTTLACFSQDITQLEKRNGFKDIKLGMIVDSLRGIKFKKEIKEKDEFPAKVYSVEHPDFANVGEVKIDHIEVKAYKDILYEISVVTSKDIRLMKALESLYGKADYDMKTEVYFWRTDNMVLKFKSHGRHHLELLYTSYVVHRMMKADKDHKVDDIANDF
jgi:hypothetical protein